MRAAYFSGFSPVIQALVTTLRILDGRLAFATGTIIFVQEEEVITKAQSSGNNALATMGAIFGFALMMPLDGALG